MKTSLLFGFILLYALSVTADAAKGGLSKDEQKKLLDEINKDRRDASGGKLRKMTYDTELEKKVAALECEDGSPILLQWNSVVQDIWTEVTHVHNPNRPLFDSRAYLIGCSKEFKCTKKIEKDPRMPEKFVGKEAVMLGACYVGPKDEMSGEEQNKVPESSIPKGSKYGDLLGLKLSSSGQVFNLIIFIAIIVFYF